MFVAEHGHVFCAQYLRDELGDLIGNVGAERAACSDQIATTLVFVSSEVGLGDLLVHPGSVALTWMMAPDAGLARREWISEVMDNFSYHHKIGGPMAVASAGLLHHLGAPAGKVFMHAPTVAVARLALELGADPSCAFARIGYETHRPGLRIALRLITRQSDYAFVLRRTLARARARIVSSTANTELLKCYELMCRLDGPYARLRRLTSPEDIARARTILAAKMALDRECKELLRERQ